MSELRADVIARIAERVIGLGVDPVEGCTLCGRERHPCPVHLGQEVGRQVKSRYEIERWSFLADPDLPPDFK